jgi:hypothetical protein
MAGLVSANRFTDLRHQMVRNSGQTSCDAIHVFVAEEDSG